MVSWSAPVFAAVTAAAGTFQIEVGQKVGLHFHVGGALFVETAVGGDLAGGEVEFAAVGIVNLLGAAGGVAEARTVCHLETGGRIIERAVVEDRGERVEIGAAVLPLVDSAVGGDRAGVGESGEPMDGVDLVAHPLAGDAGRVRPEQAVFEIFARVPLGVRAVAKEALPIGVLLLDGRRQGQAGASVRAG